MTGAALWSTLYGASPADEMLEISQRVILDIDAVAHGVEIIDGGELIFDPSASRLLQIDQQHPLCVMTGGTLTMTPASASIVHEMRFINVDESLYTAGGGMDHENNPGLCVDSGVVNLVGATKTGWTRTTVAVAQGATTCTVVDATGWRIGDEIVIAPTEAVSVSGHASHFDRRTLTNVVGNVLTFAATTYPHPSNTAPNGVVIYPEVANLTRNVLIAGQDATHRGQIMFMGDCTGSRLEYFEGKYLGPRKIQYDDVSDDIHKTLILGRYMLHFHLMGEGSRNINVTGVTMHDGGSRGLVPHASHGITFTDCVVWDTCDAGMWWDDTPTYGSDPVGSLVNETHDVMFDRCFIGRVQRPAPGSDPRFGLCTGFYLANGTNMTIQNCVVAGNVGSTNPAGYMWPDIGNGNPHNLWIFTDDDAHNNLVGLDIWQNDGNHHNIDRFRGWNHDFAAVKHGAYVNQYQFHDTEVWNNASDATYNAGLGGDFLLHAGSATTPASGDHPLEITGGHIPHFFMPESSVTGTFIVRVRNVTITSVVIADDLSLFERHVDFIECGINDTNVTVVHMHPDSVVRVQLGASAWRITSTTGSNKVVTSIATFYP